MNLANGDYPLRIAREDLLARNCSLGIYFLILYKRIKFYDCAPQDSLKFYLMGWNSTQRHGLRDEVYHVSILLNGIEFYLVALFYMRLSLKF